jgi:RNA polymerase primary sigma factor
MPRTEPEEAGITTQGNLDEVSQGGPRQVRTEAEARSRRPRSPRIAEEGGLAIFFREIRRIPLLSHAEEERLARLARGGVSHAREALVRANLRFVVKLAKNHCSPELPLEDLINEGTIGLMNAVERFDPGKGCRFVSYAAYWIRQAILRAVNEKARMIRLPRSRVVQLRQFRQGRETAGTPRGAVPPADLGGEELAGLLRVSGEMLSLESPHGCEDGESRLADFVEDHRFGRPDEAAIHNCLREEIDSVLRSLSKTEADVLRHRYGLDERRALTLRALGRKYRLTAEGVRQIELRALGRLRHPLYRGLLQSYH